VIANVNLVPQPSVPKSRKLRQNLRKSLSLSLSLSPSPSGGLHSSLSFVGARRQYGQICSR
jgi:hypothetical protein